MVAADLPFPVVTPRSRRALIAHLAVSCRLRARSGYSYSSGRYERPATSCGGSMRTLPGVGIPPSTGGVRGGYFDANRAAAARFASTTSVTFGLVCDQALNALRSTWDGRARPTGESRVSRAGCGAGR